MNDSRDKLAREQVQLVDWEHIDDVFLDMDGTLLDLHFDNHFWLEHVPKRYAGLHRIPFEEARERLLSRYADHVGTLKWYCIDHWSSELGLDILGLKEEVDHLIQLHPHVEDFLRLLQSRGKRITLLTNAHPKTLAFKLQRIPLAHHFDNLVSSHDLGLPKEEPGFWEKLQQQLHFDKRRTLFVDDSLPVLQAAAGYGIRSVIAITAPDSRQQQREIDGFLAIRDFSELL